MKTAESEAVMKDSISAENTCDFCGAKEGKAHPTRGFKVKLTPVIGEKEGSQACQVCRIHFRKKEESKKPLLSKNKIVFLSITAVVFTIVIALLLMIN